MLRSLRVRQDYIQKVKTAVKLSGYPRQQDLASELEVSLATLSNFLNGKPVDNSYFHKISEALKLDLQDIADFDRISSSNENEKVEAGAMASCLYEENTFIYVERPPIETSCYEAILSPGALVRIKAPNLMGKTSLIGRTLGKISQQGYQTVYLNLHLASKEDFTDLSHFLKWFCVSVGQILGLENQLEKLWNEQFSTPKMNCNQYFEKSILAQRKEPLVLCLDDVDRIFPYQEIASEFLGLLRAWHEQAKIRPVWKKLRLVIVHSTEVYIQLNINSSPFNVGYPIELPEFNQQQIQHLAKLHGIECSELELKQLIDLVGGHPYLVEQAFSYLKNNGNISLKNLLQTSATQAGIYHHYLQHLWRIIRQQADLVEALKKIVTANNPVRLEVEQARQLYRMGLVYLQGNDVTLRCKLYKQYFGESLGVN